MTQALQLWRQGQAAAAARLLEQVLMAQPGDAAALHLHGIVLLELGQPEQALSQLQQAQRLQPSAAIIHYNRGNALCALQREEQAAAAFAAATALEPAMVEAWFNLGQSLRRLGRLEEALAACRKALALRPQLLPGHLAMAHIAFDLGRFEDCRASCLQALALAPNDAGIFNLLGVAEQQLGEVDSALARYDRALALDPGLAEAWNNRGNALHDQRRFAEAEASFQKALDLRPDYPEAINNRGMARQDQGRLDLARADYDQAIAWRPGYREALQRRAALNLLQGRLREGWADYEAEHARGQQRPGEPPFWEGQDLRGRTLLLSEPNGLGDTLQFFRFVPALAARGARLAFKGSRSFFRLLGHYAQYVDFIEQTEGRHFDYQCWLWSLPHYLGANAPDRLADGLPWLQAEPDRVQRWSQQLDPAAFNIGVCWQGNPARKIDRGRSIPLRAFEPLARLPGVRLVSLQKHFGLEQLQDLPAGMQVQVLQDFDEGPDAFLDSAALLQRLDLLVCADTSITHVAGAMGRPAWLALNTVPDWRWMLGREDSPWYPGVRLFRQESDGEWGPVFARMARELGPELSRRGFAGQA